MVMRKLQRGNQLFKNLTGLFQRHWTLGQAILQCAALNIRRDQVVPRFVLAAIQGGQDMVMFEQCHSRNFATTSLVVVPRAPVDHLDRDLLVRIRVLGKIDLRHASPRQKMLYPVVTKSSSL